jgi:hypothetical protein
VYPICQPILILSRDKVCLSARFESKTSDFDVPCRIKFYDAWSTRYNEDLVVVGNYTGPSTSLFKGVREEEKEIRIEIKLKPMKKVKNRKSYV